MMMMRMMTVRLKNQILQQNSYVVFQLQLCRIWNTFEVGHNILIFLRNICICCLSAAYTVQADTSDERLTVVLHCRCSVLTLSQTRAHVLFFFGRQICQCPCWPVLNKLPAQQSLKNLPTIISLLLPANRLEFQQS